MNPVRALRYARQYQNWRELSSVRAANGKPRVAVLRDGTRFESPADVNVVHVVTPIFHKRVYSPPGLEIRPGDCVVDIGANIGAFSVFAAQRTRGRVLAIEPHPANAAALRRNLRVNELENASVAECAVGGAPGTLPLFLGRSGTTHQLFPASKDGGDGESVEVKVETLAALLSSQGFERVDFLKLDCEGAEGLILPSLPESLLRELRCIALEFHDDVSPVAHEPLAELLEKHGFSVRSRWDGVSPNGFLYASRPG